MTIKKTLKAIVLLNSIEEANELSIKLSKTDLNFDFKITNSLGHFISSISNLKFDCFVLDSIDLAKKLKINSKYCNIPIVLVIDKTETLFSMHSPFMVDLVIHRPFNYEELKNSFSESFKNKFKKIIPASFDVLVLDNNVDILNLITSHLKEMQHLKFDTCTSITEAKDRLSEKNYHLLLLDWDLDDGTCFDLMEFMRSKKQSISLTEALIIVITGRCHVDDILTLLQYKVENFIIKPFDYQEFKEKISYAIEKHYKTS